MSESNKKKNTGLLIFFIAFLVVSCSKPVEQKIISYTVILQSNLRQGVTDKKICISPENRTQEDMELLGLQLKKEAEKNTIFLVSIYDDEKAAKMRNKIGELNESDLNYHSQHFIGSYTKNTNSRLNEFYIMLDGNNGTGQKIKY